MSKRKLAASGSKVQLENLESRRMLSSSSLDSIFATTNLSLSPLAGSSTSSGLTPAQIKAAYGINGISFGSTSGSGAGQTIAIVDAYNDPNIASDLSTFSSAYSLQSASLSVVSQTGSTTSLPTTDADWSGEISLDVEWAHAIAPAAKILLVEANSSSMSDLLAAVNYARNASGVSVVSMSWGTSEFSSELSYNSDFTTPSGHQGVTFVASSGDSSSVEWPAISTNVLSVGGTSLSLTSSNAISSETGWSSSGGGSSSYLAEANYATSIQSTGHATSPDVSYDANPNSGFAVYDSVADDGVSGWQEVGGTSAGAPQWAALVAIADQGRTINGLGTLDGATGTLPTLYSLASNSSTYAANFTDITSGGSRRASAGSGYDLVTGLGSPKATSLVAALSTSTTTSSGWVTSTGALATTTQQTHRFPPPRYRGGIGGGFGRNIEVAATTTDQSPPPARVEKTAPAATAVTFDTLNPSSRTPSTNSAGFSAAGSLTRILSRLEASSITSTASGVWTASRAVTVFSTIAIEESVPTLLSSASLASFTTTSQLISRPMGQSLSSFCETAADAITWPHFAADAAAAIKSSDVTEKDNTAVTTVLVGSAVIGTYFAQSQRRKQQALAAKRADRCIR